MIYFGDLKLKTEKGMNIINEIKSNEHIQHPNFQLNKPHAKIILNRVKVNSDIECELIINSSDIVKINGSRIFNRISAIEALTVGANIRIEYEYGSSTLSRCENEMDISELATKEELKEAIDKIEIPKATTDEYGIVKIGEGLRKASDGSLSLNTENTLSSVSSVNPLAARQGKILNDRLEEHLLNHPTSGGGGGADPNSHTHTNKNILDGISSLNGALAFNGKLVVNDTEFSYRALPIFKNPNKAGTLEYFRIRERSEE